MKGIIRVPTKPAYAYIEAHVEGSPQELVEAYNELNDAYWNQGIEYGEGLPTKEFNALLDDYTWNGGSLTPDQLPALSKEQSIIIQAIKRSKKREIYKAQKAEAEQLNSIKNLQ